MDLAVETTLTDSIVSEAIRELQEEVGLACTPDRMLDAFNKGVVFFTDVDEVSRVHVAISIWLTVGEEELTTLEEGQIVNPTWVTPTEAMSCVSIQGMVKNEHLTWTYEPWSAIVITNIMEALRGSDSKQIPLPV